MPCYHLAVDNYEYKYKEQSKTPLTQMLTILHLEFHSLKVRVSIHGLQNEMLCIHAL